MTTSKIPSSFSSTNPTSTSSKRLSGLISGLDTDTLVQQMSSGIQSKIDKQMQNKQIALWRQQSYRQATSALTEFKNKYFSTSSNTSNILSPSFFNCTSIKNTSPCLNVTGNATAAKNMAVTKISHLAKQASISSTHKVSNEKITTGIISENWAESKISNASMTITYGGKDYAVELSNNFTFNSTNDATNIQALAKELNTQIEKIDGLKGNVSFGDDGKIAVNAEVTIKDGNENLLKGLGLTKGTAFSSLPAEWKTDASSLFSTKPLGDSLSGSTLTFSLNGISRNITFNESEKDKFSTPDKLKTYLNDKLKSAFGSFSEDPAVNPNGLGKVNVEFKDNVLSFGVVNTLNADGTVKDYNGTDIFSIDSCDKGGVLGINGALRTYAGESNRINTNKTLEDIKGSLNGTLTPSEDGTYGLKINDKVFTFKPTDTIANIISTINNDRDANVTISYSSINDSFSVAAKNGGSASRVDIKNLDGGSLANVLFGEDSASTKATLSYDFTGKSAADLAGKTITVGSTTYQFLNGGSVTDPKYKGIDISTAAGDADIATLFSNAAKAEPPVANASKLYGYDVSATGGKVTFTASIAGPRVSPNTSGDITGVFSSSDYTLSQEGEDAKLMVSFDGNPANAIEIVRGDNKFTLDGVNFELNSITDDATVSVDKPIRFTGDNKSDELYTKMKNFVDDYNALIDLANNKVSERKEKDAIYLPLTDAQKKDMSEAQITAWETKAKKGLLQGDNILNSLSLDLRHSMTDMVDSAKGALFQIGIAGKANDYSANGKLTIDEAKLKKALNDDPEKVTALFTGTDGIATRMQNVIDKNIKTSGGDGILIQKAGAENSTFVDKSSITASIQDYDTKIKELQTRLKTQQEQYYSKFTRLEQYLSKMNSQANLFMPTTTS